VVALIAIGAAAELVGIILGVLEIKSTRNAAAGFIKSARTVYLSANIRARSGVKVTGSVVTGGIRLVPTIQDHVREFEQSLAALSARVDQMPAELEALWHDDLQAVMTTHNQAERDLREALDDFAAKLGTGHWRRILAVVLLAAGATIQALAAVLSATQST